MQKTLKQQLKSVVRLVVWVLLVQFILINISAAVYAYNFTHFHSNPADQKPSSNIFTKTWKLFVGPRLYKMPLEKAPSFPHDTIHFTASNKVSIESWYSKVDNPKGCVVFFHGITGHKGLLLSEAEQFRNWGYNVMLVDFRGHGKSEGNCSSFGVSETAEVEKAFQFAQAKGNKKIILYGVSLGSVVIMKAVAEKLVQPAAIIADMPFSSLKDHMKARARIQGFPEQPFASLITFWMGVENGYNGFQHNTCTYAKNISCPVLLQWGEQDPYLKQKEMKALYQAIKIPQKKMAAYPNAQHASLFLTDPIGWTREVKAFVEDTVS